MHIKFFISKVEARKVYPNLSKDMGLELSQSNDHAYYGKIAYGTCWKVGRIFQVAGAISLIFLTIGMICASENFKKFLLGRVREIKDPYRYIYIQKQFHKNLPSQSIKEEPHKPFVIEEIQKVDKDLQKPKKLRIKQDELLNQAKMEVEEEVQFEANDQMEIQKPTLRDRFNQIAQRFQNGEMDAENDMEVFCKSLVYWEIKDVLKFSESIGNERDRKKIVNAFVKSLYINQLLYYLSVTSFDNYVAICGIVASISEEEDDPHLYNKKFYAIILDILAKKIVFQPDQLIEIFKNLFTFCHSLKQFLIIMSLNAKNKIIFEGDFPLQLIHQRGLIQGFVENVKIEVLFKYLQTCNESKIYFSLKNELIKQKKYQELLDLLEDDEMTRKKMENCTELGFKEPIYKPGIFGVDTKVIDINGKNLEVKIYEKETKNQETHYELRTKDDEKLGEIFLQFKDGILFINHIESFVRKKKCHLQVLKALHEFAFKESARRKLLGHICIKASHDTSEDFFFGYRFLEKDKIGKIENFLGALSEMIDQYFFAKEYKSESRQKDAIKKMEEFTDVMDIDESWDEIKAFERMENMARKMLNRTPRDMREILDHGVYYDKNIYLKKLFETNPLFDSDLGELFYLYLDLFFGYLDEDQKRLFLKEDLLKEKEIIQKIESAQHAAKLQKIYHDMQIEDFQSLSENNIKKIFSFISHKMSAPQYLEGVLHLCDEKIEELTKEYKL